MQISMSAAARVYDIRSIPRPIPKPTVRRASPIPIFPSVMNDNTAKISPGIRDINRPATDMLHSPEKNRYRTE